MLQVNFDELRSKVKNPDDVVLALRRVYDLENAGQLVPYTKVASLLSYYIASHISDDELPFLIELFSGNKIKTADWSEQISRCAERYIKNCRLFYNVKTASFLEQEYTELEKLIRDEGLKFLIKKANSPQGQRPGIIPIIATILASEQVPVISKLALGLGIPLALYGLYSTFTKGGIGGLLTALIAGYLAYAVYNKYAPFVQPVGTKEPAEQTAPLGRTTAEQAISHTEETQPQEMSASLNRRNLNTPLAMKVEPDLKSGLKPFESRNDQLFTFQPVTIDRKTDSPVIEPNKYKQDIA